MNSTMTARLRIVGRTLDPTADWSRLRGKALYSGLAEVLGKPEERNAYLVLAVLRAAIPTVERVRAFTRAWQISGVEPVMRRVVASQRATPGRRAHVTVSSGVLVDVTDTSTSDFVTGIQRVARETITRWSLDHDITLVRWVRGASILRELNDDERARVVGATGSQTAETREVIVPFGSTFVLPEIAVDRARADRVRTVALFGSARSVAVGFDCIPVTTAETAGDSMPGAFSRYLSALAPFSAIAAISGSSAQEFFGWKRMLAGAGLSGPDIVDLSLPFESGSATAEQIETVRRQLGLVGERIVLSVGSHEPRKNHLNLLHAAELCWRAGHEFTLVFAGGNAWKSERFFETADELRRHGRRIVMLTGVEDVVIWSLYSMATVSVFCSLNEGFGLPVVESLASGTPVITSDFGSMRELGEGHGALTVDPRSPADLATALDRIFSDESLYGRLLAETGTLPHSTWEDYARRLWGRVETPASPSTAPDDPPRKSRTR
ncbi:MAG TPA: glycosyltransferase [Terrimesophilobacter sp.]|nr:glycosyltransferase [Terrimesophilobacter sp.]